MNDFLRDLMSGRSRGLLPAALRAGLEAASLGYGGAVAWRNRKFDWELGVHRSSVPVVSVGNLTAGGTGKTPVVALLANHFRRWGVNVALLSRGYRALGEPRASSRGPRPAPDIAPPAARRRVNDEAMVLERLCPGVTHLQQADRVAAAAEAVANHGADLLLLDDGFQHRRLVRDLDIVLIDATNPFGYGHLLPRGLLREPIGSLRRADLVLLTRCDAVPSGRKRLIVDAIREVAPEAPVVEIAFPATGLLNASGERKPVEHLEETPLLAFCGIGNPEGFAATLGAAGLRPAELIALPDHHHYDPADLARLGRRARAYGVPAAVTTVKDLVKIRSDALPGPTPVPIWAVETGCEVVANATALFDRLDALVGRVAGRRAA